MPLVRQLLEGINYEEIVKEVNRGQGRLPGLIGFDPNRAADYDGGAKVRARCAARTRTAGSWRRTRRPRPRLAGTSGRQYDLVAIGAHGLGRQPLSQLGGVVARALRDIEKDMLIVRDEPPLEGGRYLVCMDGSSYSYRAMRIALELAHEFGASLFVCSAFDVEYHHVVFHNIKDVLSVQASKVFKFEEQEELHNNIIDKGLLKLCQANLKRAEVMAQEFPDVQVKTQILIGKPFQVILQWAEEIQPSLLVLARHGSAPDRRHRSGLAGREPGPARALHRAARPERAGIRPEDIPWIEEDGMASSPWAPEAEVRILRVPPFAQGIARKAVEEFVLEQGGDVVTNARLDEAIRKLLPTHMQLIMGIGTAEEIALAEVKAEEQIKKTHVVGRGRRSPARRAGGRGRSARSPAGSAPAPAPRPIRSNGPTKPSRACRQCRSSPGRWRGTRWSGSPATHDYLARHHARDGREQAGHDRGGRVRRRDTMMVMFNELRAKQIRAEAEGGTACLPRCAGSSRRPRRRA